jgi:hypothetical protein
VTGVLIADVRLRMRPAQVPLDALDPVSIRLRHLCAVKGVVQLSATKPHSRITDTARRVRINQRSHACGDLTRGRSSDQLLTNDGLDLRGGCVAVAIDPQRQLRLDPSQVKAQTGFNLMLKRVYEHPCAVLACYTHEICVKVLRGLLSILLGSRNASCDRFCYAVTPELVLNLVDTSQDDLKTRTFDSSADPAITPEFEDLSGSLFGGLTQYCPQILVQQGLCFEER